MQAFYGTVQSQCGVVSCQATPKYCQTAAPYPQEGEMASRGQGREKKEEVEVECRFCCRSTVGDVAHSKTIRFVHFRRMRQTLKHSGVWLYVLSLFLKHLCSIENARMVGSIHRHAWKYLLLNGEHIHRRLTQC